MKPAVGQLKNFSLTTSEVRNEYVATEGRIHPLCLGPCWGERGRNVHATKAWNPSFYSGGCECKDTKGYVMGTNGIDPLSSSSDGVATLSGCAAKWLRSRDCGTAREPTAGNIYHIHDISNTRLEETRGPNTRCPSTVHSPSVFESGSGFLFLPRGNGPLLQP